MTLSALQGTEEETVPRTLLRGAPSSVVLPLMPNSFASSVCYKELKNGGFVVGSLGFF